MPPAVKPASMRQTHPPMMTPWEAYQKYVAKPLALNPFFDQSFLLQPGSAQRRPQFNQNGQSLGLSAPRSSLMDAVINSIYENLPFAPDPGVQFDPSMWRPEDLNYFMTQYRRYLNGEWSEASSPDPPPGYNVETLGQGR